MGLRLGEALGRADLVDQLHGWEPSRISDGAYSWYGPAGALIVLAAVPVAIWEVRRRRQSTVALAFAAAPILAIGLISLAISYQHHQGRYFAAAIALCVATCGGFALTYRPVGAAIVEIAGATVLSLV